MLTAEKHKFDLELRFYSNSDSFKDPILKYVCHCLNESMLELFCCVEEIQDKSKFAERYSFFSLPFMSQ